MIDSDFVQAVQRPEPSVLEVYGRKHLMVPDGNFMWRREDLAAPDVLPEPVALATLGGLVTYLSSNRDKLDLDTLTAQVASTERVNLWGPVFGPFKQRILYAYADHSRLTGGKGFRFDAFIDSESFVIGVQANFLNYMDREAVLRMASGLTDGPVRVSQDDGVSQTVTVKTGVVMKAEVAVPNPVHLAPWRTFREIDQPESPFVFRLRAGAEGERPTCALFQADGDSWRYVALERIWAWLTARLPTSITVIS